MTLLLIPARDPLEGPLGYRARVAQENLLSSSTLQGLIEDGIVDEAAWRRDVEVDAPASFIRRWARFCPRCLSTLAQWRMGWELRFADACPKCGDWLVDVCPACATRLTWRRPGMAACPACHANLLFGATSSAAPPALVQLSRALEQCALGESRRAIPVFDGLKLAQCTQLVRLLGAYACWDGGRVPQKILDSDQLSVSWALSTAAAETLVTWPKGFWWLLDLLRSQAAPAQQGRIGCAVGGLYSAIYRGLKDPGFDFVREAFEEYVAQSWTGALGRRNRRLNSLVLERVAWLHPRAACKDFGISTRLLHRLADQGLVQVVTRVSESGRNFLMVRKVDLARWQAESGGFVTLQDAALELGLKRQRLAALLPTLCPDALKSSDRGAAWSIPKAWLQTWRARLETLLAVRRHDPSEMLTIDHVLRYRALDERAIARLFLAIQTGAISLQGALGGRRRVSAALVRLGDVQRELAAGASGDVDWLGIPEVALHLGVKQEVAYFLVRNKLLPARAGRERGRLVQRIRRQDLDGFNETYVFARDLARQNKRSARSVAASLRGAGIAPVSGPGTDGGRQLLYRRYEVEAAIGCATLRPAQAPKH